PGYKRMILESSAADIVYTPAVSGIPGSFLKASLRAVGLDPKNLPAKPGGYHAKVARDGAGDTHLEEEVKAWKHVWSAGQGVGSIGDAPAVADLVRRLIEEYEAAL